MSQTTIRHRYHCLDDCEMKGCPGHTATLELESVSGSLHFSDGKGQDIYMHTPELEALLVMLDTLSGCSVEIGGIEEKLGAEISSCLDQVRDNPL